MNIRFFTILVVAGIALSACAEQMRQQEAAEDNSTCESYGLKLGDPEYVECRFLLARLRVENRAATSAALMGYGLGMMQMGQPYTLSPSPSTSTSPSTINCFQRGAWTTCNAY